MQVGDKDHPLAGTTVISGRDNGTYLVERYMCGALMGRYTTASLASPRKDKAEWIQRVALLSSQPSMPVQPALVPMHRILWIACVLEEMEVV